MVSEILRIFVFVSMSALMSWVYLRRSGVGRPVREWTDFAVGTIFSGFLLVVLLMVIKTLIGPFADWMLEVPTG